VVARKLEPIRSLLRAQAMCVVPLARCVMPGAQSRWRNRWHVLWFDSPAIHPNQWMGRRRRLADSWGALVVEGQATTIAGYSQRGPTTTAETSQFVDVTDQFPNHLDGLLTLCETFSSE